MRTLKKVLALSLVFAMAFTMMAGAAFKDQDKIDSSLTNDIQLLTALGVFQGDENGNFNPTDNVRRSEAAKMIYVLKNNGVDDGAVAFQGVSKYSDVPVGHWAEGYINYCTNLGYMSGWQENGVQKFDPNGDVTGVELMKMLLCMIGYKADVQGYTNSSAWQTNVLVDAATSGLSVEFAPSVYGATPRQWTARLMTNALDAKYVTYNKGELTYADETYAEFALKLETSEGILMNAGKVALDNAATPTDVVLDDDGDQIVLTGVAAGEETTFKTTVDASLLGQDVKVYYRAGTTTDTNKVYAVLTTGDSKVYETTLGDVTVDTYDSGETIKFAGYNNGVAKKYADSTDIYVIYNLNDVDTLTATNGTPEFGAIAGNSSNPVRFVDQDGDGYIDLAFVTTTKYAIVDEYNADKNTLKFVDAGDPAGSIDMATEIDAITGDIDSAEEMEHVNIEGTIAEDDVVAINIDTTSGEQMVVVSKMEPITTSVTAYTLNSAGTEYNAVTINGTSTKFGKFAMNAYDKTTANGTVLDDTTFYTDGKYIVYSTGGEATVSVENLAYVTATNVGTSWGENTYKVRVLLADGTVGEYVVDAVYDEAGVKVAEKATVDALVGNSIYTGTATGITGDTMTAKNRYATATDVTDALTHMFNPTNGSAKENVFSYSISGDKIVLRALKNDANTTFANEIQTYDNDSKKVTAGGEYKLADNAYFFVKTAKPGSDTKYSVVKASELAKDQTSQSAGVFAYKTVSGIPTFLFGVLNLNTSVAVTEAEYAFVKSVANYAVVDGEYLAQMTVILPDGTETVISKKFSDSSSANAEVVEWNKLRGNVVTYEMDGNYVDGNIAVVGIATDNKSLDDSVAAEEWVKMEIVGWSNNLANVKVNKNAAALVAVASDVKIHYVDCTSESYAVIDSASKVENSQSGVQSALAYVQDVNGINTITDIFVEVDGADISKVW